LTRSAAQIRQQVVQLGGALDGPWRAEEKSAAIAAWMML
jgi:hypothetical protein